MVSEYGYRFTKKAEDDVDDIIGYMISMIANPTAASHFMERLQDSIREARCFPESGSPVQNEFLPENTVRKKIVGNYVLYYYPDTQQKMITVLRVVYGRRNMDEIINQLKL